MASPVTVLFIVTAVRTSGTNRETKRPLERVMPSNIPRDQTKSGRVER
jgi:hypothetical protein